VTTFKRVQGDTNDKLLAMLRGVETFTGASVAAHIWRKGTNVVTLPATVTAEGVCTVALGSWITTAATGTWLVEYQVTFGDGTVATWPDEKPDVLIVRPQGA
jgi:hypothetical protein